MTTIANFTNKVLGICNGYVFKFSNKDNIAYITNRLNQALVDEFGEKVLDKLEVEITCDMNAKYCVNIQFKDKDTGEYRMIFDEEVYNELKNL